MSISDKIKTFDNKSKQNKAQCNLDWETANISALSSENVSKYDFLIGYDVLPEKDLTENFRQSSRLKTQTSVAGKCFLK